MTNADGRLLMNDPKTCPDCFGELRETVAALKQGEEKLEGYYQVVLVCPNKDHHGSYVQCANGCGKQVPNKDFHYSYTPGLIGSGSWSCFPNDGYGESTMEELSKGRAAVAKMRSDMIKKTSIWRCSCGDTSGCRPGHCLNRPA